MNAVIIHECRGRMRLQCRLKQKEMSLRQADLLEAWFQQQSWTSRVTVHERTGCVILYYTGARETVLRAVGRFSWEQAEQSVSLPAHSSRMLNRQFERGSSTVVSRTVYAGRLSSGARPRREKCSFSS